MRLLSCTSRKHIRNGKCLAFYFLFARAYSLQSKNNDAWNGAALKASEYFSEAKSILFVTGAGISAESGLPTYRGVSGLYNANGGETPEGYSIEECLSSSMYRQNPEVTWKYISQIERSCRGVEPSRAHSLLAAAEKNVEQVTVMTQNIDGLHDRAGSTDVIELHGNLLKLSCTACDHKESVTSYAGLDERGHFPPKCKACGKAAIRPGIVLFDEFLGDLTCRNYEDRLGTTMGNLMWTWQERSPNPKYDLSVVIGTSALFPYVNAAALAGAKTVEINPTRTALSDLVDVYVPAKATEALDFLYKNLDWIE